ncbi:MULTISPECIES: cytochrome bd-I oxidase subunit CydH [Photobacterium]
MDRDFKLAVFTAVITLTVIMTFAVISVTA